jgi:hypothetical protein
MRKEKGKVCTIQLIQVGCGADDVVVDCPSGGCGVTETTVLLPAGLWASQVSIPGARSNFTSSVYKFAKRKKKRSFYMEIFIRSTDP